MRRRKADEGLEFEALRHAIEHCDPDVMLGFYAELSIVNASVPQASLFELRGRAEITKHLRATFGQKTSHRVGRVVVGEEKVTFREACDYPDGSRVLIETTLEVRDGKIIRQTDAVAEVARAEAPPSECLPSSEQETEKVDRTMQMIEKNETTLSVILCKFIQTSLATTSHETALSERRPRCKATD